MNLYLFEHKMKTNCIIDDILLRRYLSVKTYITDSIHNSNLYYSIPIFTINDDLIATGYIINTKYYNIEIPIIGIKEIRKKIILLREFMIKHSSKKREWKIKNIQFINNFIGNFILSEIIRDKIIPLIY